MKFLPARKLQRKLREAEEAAPLLLKHDELKHYAARSWRRRVAGAMFGRWLSWGGVLRFVIYWLGFVFVIQHFEEWSSKIADAVVALPKDPHKAAKRILDRAPVIDGHIDLPIFVRAAYANNASAFDLNGELPQHVDIPRLKRGQVGGFFWSAFVACADWAGYDEGPDFLNSTWRVRDTLEQVDISKILIEKYSDTFQLALTTQDIKHALKAGKIASMIGVEGGHQLGNSIAVMRQLYALGVRYITLTHTCHNAFADSCGTLPAKWGGLSPLGHSLIDEMNRIGMLVDLSHTSDDTARQALKYSKAPVIWSHSSARAVHTHERNVPDDILAMVGTGKDKTDAVVMVNFAPDFVADPDEATVQVVADHVEHIAKIAGKKHVGLGSDFDGIGSTPKGLEDVSKYPELIAELLIRNWTRSDIEGLTNKNLLRVMKGAEDVARQLQKHGAQPAYDYYDKRTDLGQRRREL
ncbi:M19 family dipeptidase [Phanerochaete sordida]|uniref:Dipeptidase n=1 Tax=Phanerochaete sordida TaxID=48140 RepID=A0A9P3G749_9APHY|nr:M19 family dipeptidase [Phanerochaete sordida]